MRTRLAGRWIGSVALIACTRSPHIPASAAPQRTLEIQNGRWFDGTSFRERVWYVVDGRLTARRPSRVDSVIDAAGRFVVPPFGEAHNHNVDGSALTASQIRMYLAQGAFYVMNHGNSPFLTNRVRDSLNTPRSIDIAYANSSLNARDGHGVERYETFLRGGRIFPRSWTPDSLEGQGVILMDSVSDVDRKWPTVIASRPDFIKVELLFSEEYARRRDDRAYYGRKGLDPAVVRAIVERAHGSGLRVSAHVETVTDFRNAVRAGADIIAHLPGFGINETGLASARLTDDDAIEARRRNVTVITTIRQFDLNQMTDIARRDMIWRDVIIHNLSVLKRSGVRLAIGSDMYRETSVRETLDLAKTGVFTNGELLTMLTHDTPRLIFPTRRIGTFADGNEASFLALDADPSVAIDAITRVSLRVKQAQILPP